MKIVAELATALDLVRSRANSVLDPDELTDIDDIVDRVDERRGFPGETYVVALAGGTGAGKSSLLNALAGAEVASVSAVRPHTDQPLALIPEAPSFELETFLDDMGIVDRSSLDRFTEVAIIDLPDQDSVAHEHRELVWQVLPEADAIVWVSDPDKYHDATFLDDYVGGLVAYQDQALFVINKSDLLTDAALAEVQADFVGQLEVRGIVDPTVFVTAAAPPHQDASGVDALARHLAERMEAKKVMASKTVADVAQAVSLIAQRAQLTSGGAVGYDERWGEAKTNIEASLAAGDATGAVAAMDGFVHSLVDDVGPSFGRRLLAAIPPHLVELEFTGAARGPKGAPGRKKRRRRRAEPEETPQDPLDLDGVFGAPLRELMWERAYLGATIAAAAVQAAQAQARLAG